jgi:hypothetical protein
MYEKPELTLVGNAASLVLGPIGSEDDSDLVSLQSAAGLVQGLDD